MWPDNCPPNAPHYPPAPQRSQYLDGDRAANYISFPPQPLIHSPPVEFDEPPLRMDSPSRLQLDAKARALKDKILQNRAKQRGSAQPQQQLVNVSASDNMASKTASSHEDVNELLQDVLRQGRALTAPEGGALTTAALAATAPFNSSINANTKDSTGTANTVSSQEEGEITGTERRQPSPRPLALPPEPQLRESISNPALRSLSTRPIKDAQKTFTKEPTLKQNHHRRNSFSAPKSIRGSRDRPAIDLRGSDDRKYHDHDTRDSGNRDSYPISNQDRTQLNRPHQSIGNRVPIEPRQTDVPAAGRHGMQVTKPTLQDLLAVDEDLRLFLKYHDWFDLEKRAEKLQQCRHLAAIDAERAEILAKLKGEQKSTTSSLMIDADAANRVSLTHHPSAFSLPGSALRTPIDAIGPSHKRPYESSGEDRYFKTPRLEDQGPGHSPSHYHRAFEHSSGEYDHHLGSSHGPYPHHSPPGPSERPRDAYSRQSPRPSSRDRHAPTEDRPSRRYDSYRGGAGSSTRDRQGLSKSHKSDVEHRSETRFFLVKSFNEENVRHSMQDGLWTTQVQNGEMLENAFNKCENVILIFSINKSKAFQGWARMASAPDSSIPRPNWMKGIHWPTSAPFRIEWRNRTSTSFSMLHQLGPNKLNEAGDLPVYVGKDGQELDEDSGFAVLELMDSVEQGRRGRERPGARERDDNHHRKRENDGEWKGKREPDY